MAQTEKAIATHSSTLAWKIPWTEEPGRLQSMGSWRIGHYWATSLSLFTFMHWRRKWQPTPVFLPGESQGWWSLVGCCLWGLTESDTTEATKQQQQMAQKSTLLTHMLWDKDHIPLMYFICPLPGLVAAPCSVIPGEGRPGDSQVLCPYTCRKGPHLWC